jgi:uncharacterized protein
VSLENTPPEPIRDKLEPLSGSFRFACHPGVPCFTECCRDLNLMLTPYDILRLKNGLGLRAEDFLDRFADCSFDDQRNLPMLSLRMMDNERRTCPFVTSAGCSVYGDRPSACRIYPVARASRLHRMHGAVIESYFVLREDHCRGFLQDRSWTAEEWIGDQALALYYESNDQWMEIVTHPLLRDHPTLSPKQQQLFYLASYDLDKFRDFVFKSRFLSLFEITEEEAEAVRASDELLLALAYRWVKFSLLKEPALKLRENPH